MEERKCYIIWDECECDIYDTYYDTEYDALTQADYMFSTLTQYDLQRRLYYGVLYGEISKETNVLNLETAIEIKCYYQKES